MIRIGFFKLLIKIKQEHLEELWDRLIYELDMYSIHKKQSFRFFFNFFIHWNVEVFGNFIKQLVQYYMIL